MISNDYTVYTVKPGYMEEPMVKAHWLGHSRFRCEACSKGYFNVRSENDHDAECPHCKWVIAIRYTGK